MFTLAQRVLIILLPAAVFVVLVCQKFDKRIATEFCFDNRSGKYDIQQLSVSADFNDWSRNRHFLRDTEENNLWRVIIPLNQGSYLYRFILNGQRWLRDPNNSQYAGPFSNSFIYVDSMEYPQVIDLHPRNGSWIYQKIDSLIIKFNKSVPRTDQFELTFLLDARPVPFIMRDSLIIAPLPDLSEGKHYWQVLITNMQHDTVYTKEGLWNLNYQNQAPHAEAGYSQFTHLNQTIELNAGRSYDPDGDGPLQYRWQKIGGSENYMLKDADTPFPKFSASKAGVYRFRLTVRDTLAGEGSDETEVIVLNAQQPQTIFSFDPSYLPQKVDKVSLVGEFNQWQATKHNLIWNERSGQWEIELALTKGQYEYKYVINDQEWIVDPANPNKIEDGWKGFNSIKFVDYPLPFNFNIQVDSVLDKGSFYEVPLNIFEPADVQVWCYSDINNPTQDLQRTTHGLRFNKNNPKGHYYYYYLLQKDGYYSKSYTLLVNHYTETKFIDFSDSPSWPDTSIVYELFVRRYTPDGTLQALIERLPALKEFGINTLWLMPVYEGPTEHGYAPTEFFNIERDYGTLQDYQSLIDQAHQLGMKVVFDFVANHLSDQHGYVYAAADNPASPLRHWFFWGAEGNWKFHNDWDTLVNLNFNNPQVRYFILEVARFWLGLGVDGFRCDVAWAIPHSFWKDFRRTVKEINPDCLLIDEVLPRQQIFHDDAFDMSYDTDFYGNILDVLNDKKPLSALDYGLQKTLFNYPVSALDLRYIENHDLPRFISLFGEPKTRLMAALLFSVPGTPLIYYGQELGLQQMRPVYPQNSNSKWFDFYQTLLKLRCSKVALQKGKMITVDLDDKNKIWHFRRLYLNDSCDVFINLSTWDQKINLSANISKIYLGSENLKDENNVYYLKKESFIICELVK